MNNRKTSVLEGDIGFMALANRHSYPPHKSPEPVGCQALSIAKSAEEDSCTSVMTELITQRAYEMEKLCNDPEALLKVIITDQITEYRAMSGALSMGIYTSKQHAVMGRITPQDEPTPENLIPLKIKVDKHLLNIASTLMQLEKPSGQIKITNNGQFNVAVAQKIENVPSAEEEVVVDDDLDGPLFNIQ